MATKALRNYIHCIRCQMPLESPVIKRCETETWYIDFATCDECKETMLNMAHPAIEFSLDGECLKKLLRAKKNALMVATVIPEKGQ